jgi:hypothetical protein
MKIALYYTGLIRTMKVCYPKVLELLKGYDVDVYLSVWNDPGHSLKGIEFIKSGNKENIFDEIEYNEELIKEEFPDLNFKVIDIEEIKNEEIVINELSNNLTFSEYIHSNGVSNKRYQSTMLVQHYKINRCNNFRKTIEEEQNIKYDWYLRIRPDSEIGSIPDLSSESKVIYFNKYVWEDNLESFTNDMTNEMIWMTNDSNYMDYACDVINNVPDIWEKEIFAEKLMYKHMKIQNLNIEMFDFGLKLLRSHGYKQIMGQKRNW